jgi:tetratricopeptide (TPR) repeat protein
LLIFFTRGAVRMKAGFLNAGKPAAPKADVFGDLLGGAFGASKPSGPMGAAKAQSPATNKSSPTPAAQSQASWSNVSAGGADDFLKGLGVPPPKPAPGPAAAAPSTDDLLAAFAGNSAPSRTNAAVSSTPSYSNPGEAAADVDNLPPPPANVDGPTAASKANQALAEGSYADAIKWYTWSLQLTAPSDTSTMITILLKRAEANKENGEHKKAIADTTQAIQLQPDNDKAILKRAYLYEGLEKYKLALADYKHVVELGRATVTIEKSVLRMEQAIKQLG